MHPIFRDTKVIPVVTIEREADAIPLARALARGGLGVIEVTLRTPVAAAAIAAIARDVPEVVVGAGTILRDADVTRALAAGARFLVSPGLTPELAGAGLAAEVPSSIRRQGRAAPPRCATTRWFSPAPPSARPAASTARMPPST